MWPFGRRDPTPLGPRGEKLARRMLRRVGMKILAANYRCPAGEADLIALDRSTRRQFGAETLVFVEVKTRSSDRYTDPASAVDADKQRHLEKIADHYLATHDAADLNVRFDIVSIVIPPDGTAPRIRHIPDAF